MRDQAEPVQRGVIEGADARQQRVHLLERAPGVQQVELRLRNVQPRAELGLVVAEGRRHARRLLVAQQRIGQAAALGRDVAKAIRDAREHEAIADRLQCQPRLQVTGFGAVEVILHHLRDAAPAPGKPDAATLGRGAGLRNRAPEVAFRHGCLAEGELAIAQGGPGIGQPARCRRDGYLVKQLAQQCRCLLCMPELGQRFCTQQLHFGIGRHRCRCARVQRQRTPVLTFQDRRAHARGQRQHVRRHGRGFLAPALRRQQVAQLVRDAAGSGQRIAGARTDEAGAGTRPGQCRLQLPVAAFAAGLGRDHQRRARPGAQFVEVGRIADLRRGRDRRLVGHDRMARQVCQRVGAEGHHAQPHPAIVGTRIPHVRRQHEDEFLQRPWRLRCRDRRGLHGSAVLAAACPHRQHDRTEQRRAECCRKAHASPAPSRRGGDPCSLLSRRTPTAVLQARFRGVLHGHFRRFDRRDPLVTEARHRADVVLRVAVVAERTARLQDGLCQDRIAAVGAPPYGGDQFIPADGAMPVADEVGDEVEHPAAEFHRHAGAKEATRFGIEFVLVETVRHGG